MNPFSQTKQFYYLICFLLPVLSTMTTGCAYYQKQKQLDDDERQRKIQEQIDQKEEQEREERYALYLSQSSPNVRQAIKYHQLLIGMTETDVIWSWELNVKYGFSGRQLYNKRVTTNTHGTSEQWEINTALGRKDKSIYLYFDNGKLTTIQE